MKLRVLMWKLMVSRYKRYFQTAIEIIFCIFCLYMLYKMNSMMKPGKKNDIVTRNIVTHETFVFPKNNTQNQIVYYPKTIATDNLMNLVGNKLQLKKLDTLRGSGYYGTNNMSLIETYLKDINDNNAVILFEKMQNHDLPQNLTYTIRCLSRYGDFMVHTIKADPTYLSYPKFGHVYEKFMRLQWAVDTAFIELKNGSTINQNISFKEFDSPPEQKEVEITMMRLMINTIFNVFSLSLIFMFHVGRVVEDRISGVQALLTMSGVSSFMLNLSHFLNGMIFGIFHVTVLMIFYCIMGSQDNRFIYYSNPFLVFIFFLMYYCGILMFGFLIAFALPSKKMIVASALGIYLATIFPLSLMLVDDISSMNGFLQFLLGLVPHQPLYFFFIIIIQNESTEVGLNFGNLFEMSEMLYMTPFFVFFLILFQICLYGGIAYYLSLVRPGKYVTPLPWGFLCKKSFWRKRVTPDLEMAEVTEPLQNDSQYFEQGPSDSQIGITIIDVSKVYNKNRVLTNLNLNIYKGEITVLLGHNGAGKTTILSIIAGMNRATHGKVLINGLDTVKYRKNIFKAIGVCPQENVFFRDLSVLQHVIFFTMLRTNVGYKRAKNMSMELLQQLKLSDKYNSTVTQISGGMMRRVQLACALAGDADILILDEPTSGLDVETRRELWDLLLSIRGNRTVLLSTHFMEEADVLGDRVAALHKGQLRCHATPDYLKKAVGKGYILTLVTLGLPKTNEITEVVVSNVPEASMNEVTLNCITFNLPLETTKKFPQLFQSLEDNRDSLCIESIGVGTATLEEVFLTLCSDVDIKFTKDTIDTARRDIEYEKVKGCKLILRQLRALFSRQIKFIIHNKYTFLIMHVLLPIIFLVLSVKVMNGSVASGSTPNALMDLSIFKPLTHKKILLDIEEPNLKKMKTNLRAAYKDFEFEDVKDINKVTGDAGLIDPSEYKKYLLGLKVDNESAQVLYTTWVRHAAPVALNLLTNLLSGENHSITTYNQPARLSSSAADRTVKSQIMIENISITVTDLILIWLACITATLPKERTTGTRHIFLMYGCPAIMYWLFTWIYHLILCTIFAIIPSVVVIYALEENFKTQDDGDYLRALFLVYLVGSSAVLAVLYFMTMHHKDFKFSIVSCILIVIFGWVMPYVSILMQNIQKTGFFLDILELINIFLPVYTISNAAVATGKIASKNAQYKLKMCMSNSDTTIKECFAQTTNVYCYVCSDADSVSKFILILFLQAIAYMVLVILTQLGVFAMVWDWMTNKRYRELMTTSNDPEALAEITYVSNAMNLPPSKVSDAMLVHQVHKRYPQLIKPSVEAVKGVSISIKKGECFGLVGVNGAGKSTLFSMIVGSSHITRGTILCNGIRATRLTGKYIHQLGFCPQHHSLDNFMTGEENLSFLLKLRGFKDVDIQTEVDYWMSIVALEKYRRKLTGSYSGGCRRRLAAAAALMSDGGTTLLDEPSAGVDVAARRALWMALKAGQRGGRSVVVSSHSMEEIEALCNRVCILVAGEVQALATPTEMRRRYGTGHSLHINICTDKSIPPDQNVDKLKTDVEKAFLCKLEDSNRSMLHYRITQTMKYSDIFSAVEGLKARYPQLIQDYTVKEPTLEQVFLSFARQNKENTTVSNATQSPSASV